MYRDNRLVPAFDPDPALRGVGPGQGQSRHESGAKRKSLQPVFVRARAGLTCASPFALMLILTVNFLSPLTDRVGMVRVGVEVQARVRVQARSRVREAGRGSG